MPTEVILPRVDMDMAEGKIGKWHVKEGQLVTKGEPIFEIETDKAAMEIEAPVSGTIREISVPEGATAAVGAAVAWIYADGEAARVVAAAPAAILRQAQDGDAAKPPSPHAEPVEARGKQNATAKGVVPATPLARRLARERGIDLSALDGTGPRGRVQSEDVPVLAPRLADPPKAIAGPRSARTDLPELNLVRKGSLAAPPAVFIHGFGSELSIWKTTLAALDPAQGVIQLDLPAHGKSALGSVESFEDIVESVALALETAGVGACHIIGHSFGGVIAMAMAAERRVDVRALMLVSPAGLGPDIEREFLQGFTRATRVESLMPWLRLLYAKPSLVSTAFARAILDGRDDETLRAQQRQILDTMFPDGTQAIDLSETLSSLTIPCKVVWGRQDRIIPVAHSANLPGNVALHLLADTGHVPHLEQPALVARLIEELVRTAR
jgi:pimeloyl-ACP methyl ester carboxylesterase